MIEDANPGGLFRVTPASASPAASSPQSPQPSSGVRLK